MTGLQLSFSQYIKAFSGDCLFDEPLKNHCTFKIGGAGEILYIPHDEKALSAALAFAKNENAPVHILGNGSNVLISDKGLKGLVIQLMNGLHEITYLENGIIYCQAGASLKKLCSFALEKSLTGLEFAYGIPGSVGGAIYMNAGAYGGEMKNVLTSVRSMDKYGGDIREEKTETLDYSYRNTAFMKNERIISAGYFRLDKGERESIGARMNELMEKRKSSQPLQYPSAGSVFKRPAEGFAAALIDECGLKGLSVGGAQVSEKHAGFIVNTGKAVFSDVCELIEKIKAEVFNRRGIMLQTEIEILRD